MSGSPEHLGPAAQRRAQTGLAGVALAHFQEACAEIRARHGIVRTVCKGVPVGIGGGGIFTVQQQDAGERRQYFGATGGCFTGPQKDRPRLAAFVAVQMQAREIQLQLDGLRRQRNSAFDDGDGLIDAPGLGKLAGEFLESRRKRRPPRRGPAQLFNRFLAASGAAQRRPEQGFDTSVAAVARGPFERRDRFPVAVLTDQGPSQDRSGGGVSPARSEHFSGELLGLGEPPHSQRGSGAFERLGAAMLLSAADGGEGGRLRHRDINVSSFAIATTAAKRASNNSLVKTRDRKIRRA